LIETANTDFSAQLTKFKFFIATLTKDKSTYEKKLRLQSSSDSFQTIIDDFTFDSIHEGWNYAEYTGLTPAKAFRLVNNESDGCKDIETSDPDFSVTFTGIEMIADSSPTVACSVVVDHSYSYTALPDVTYTQA
jgi:hypothetical protein